MQFRIYKYENGGGGGELHNAYEAATAAEALAPFASSEGLDPELIEAEAKVAASWIGARDGAAGVAGERILSRAGTKIGSFVPYENAHIYWAVGTNAAYAIPHGGLFEAYGLRGYELGELGFPIMRHSVVTAHGVTAGVQSFKGGVLMTPTGGPVAGCLVHGEIGRKYKELGWETSALGLPASDEQPVPGTDNIVQHFQFGKLKWSPTGVIVEVEQ